MGDPLRGPSRERLNYAAEHLIGGCLCRQCDVTSTQLVTLLQALGDKKRGFGLALSHGCFHDDQGGQGQFTGDEPARNLKWTRIYPEELLEVERLRQSQPGSPPQSIERRSEHNRTGGQVLSLHA